MIGVYSYIEYKYNTKKNIAKVSIVLKDNLSNPIKNCPILIDNQLKISEEDGVVRFDLDTLILKDIGYDYEIIEIPCKLWKGYEKKFQPSEINGDIDLTIEIKSNN
jgi:hypothetical protein